MNSVIRSCKNVGLEFYRNKTLYGMTIPGLLLLFVFSYLPMYGMIIAFKQFNIIDGIIGSGWVGMKNFEFYFRSSFFLSTTFNTLLLNGMFIGFGLVLQVGFALLLNEVGNKVAKKFFQSALFIPHFLSWIVVAVFVYNLLSNQFGVVNSVLRDFGIEGVVWYNKPYLWRFILLTAHAWKYTGFNVVIYLASITNIDSEQYEAARIDGANQLQEVLQVTIPHLTPTIVIMTLLQIGRIFYGDFQMIYALVGDNGMLLPTTDVIDTYVYRAMRVHGEFGMAAAVGMYQSVLGFLLVLSANKIVKRIDKDYGLF